MINAPVKPQLDLDWFEAGVLYGVLSDPEIQRKIPGGLKLKLKMMFTSAYLGHPTFGIQAQKEMTEYERQLGELNKEENA